MVLGGHLVNIGDDDDGGGDGDDGSGIVYPDSFPDLSFYCIHRCRK